MSAPLSRQDAVLPSTEDRALATDASRALSQLDQDAELKVRIDDRTEIPLPREARRLLSHILKEMAVGNAVTVIPIHAELTTQHAADYLQVSRPYLIGLLKKNEIAFHMVGTHRRVKFRDLVEYKKKIEAERQTVMDELAAEAQDLNLGY